MAIDPNQIFRDYNVEGDPSSQPFQPALSDMRAWANDVNNRLDAYPVDELTTALETASQNASDAQSAADLASSKVAEVQAAVSAAGSIEQVARGTVYQSPDDIGVVEYQTSEFPNGSKYIVGVRYEDGRSFDLSAPSRGAPDSTEARGTVFQSPADTDVAGYERGDDGNIIGLWRADGSYEPLGGVRGAIIDADDTVSAYIDGTTLKATDGATSVSFGDAFGVAPVASKKGKFKTIRKLSSGAPFPVIADLKAALRAGRGVASPALGNVLYHVITIAQSVGAGSQGAPVLAPYNSGAFPSVWMLNNSSASFQDIRCGKYRGNPDSCERIRESDLTDITAFMSAAGAGNVHGMTPLDSFGVHWAKTANAAFGVAPNILLSCVAIGGTPFRRWKRTPDAMITPISGIDVGASWRARDEFDDVVTAGKRIAAAHGMGYRVLAILSKGGEADDGYVNASTDLAQVIDEINYDLTTPASAIYCQDDAPIWLATTPCSFADPNTKGMSAYLDAQASGKLNLVAADYALMALGGAGFGFASGAQWEHPINTGYVRLGDYLALAIGDALLGRAYSAPKFGTPTRVGNVLTFPVTGGDGSSLVVDTTTITERANTNAGFRYLVSGTPVAITSVAVNGTDPTKIDVTLPSYTAGSVVEYAMFGHTDALIGTRARGNVRQSTAYVSGYDAANFYQWALPGKWSI